jgi:hypothetical protein
MQTVLKRLKQRNGANPLSLTKARVPPPIVLAKATFGISSRSLTSPVPTTLKFRSPNSPCKFRMAARATSSAIRAGSNFVFTSADFRPRFGGILAGKRLGVSNTA